MDQSPLKTQIVERIKQANNVLVTISTNPSVDQLAACIGMTLLLNKVDKHATAVFSGQVPSTVEFLQPEKTLEKTTDSLRDFIISLDKNKADKLRYKVEDKVVRIFITPYKTSLSEKDLQFSQGDFNVDVVLALGVKDRSQLDAAITAHGRILHDATVVAVSAGPEKAPNIGQINWQDPAASSLCEMLVSISEAFAAGLIDNQIATAFLTGIVAETQRFSNKKTSPKVMTMSAQLMAAGANQQLIVSKLEPPAPPPAARQPAAPKAPQPLPTADMGTLSISHEPERPDSMEVEVKPDEIHIDEHGNIQTAEGRTTPTLTSQTLPPDMPKPIEPETVSEAPEPVQPALEPAKPAEPSTLASPLKAEEAKEETEAPSEATKPHTIMDPKSYQPAMSSPLSADTQPSANQNPFDASFDPLGEKHEHDEAVYSHAHKVQPPTVDSARSAVQNAVAGAPFDPATAGPIDALNARPLDSNLNAAAPSPGLAQPIQAESAQITPKVPPPPVPPPLNVGSGAMIPTYPPSNAQKTK